MQSRNPNVGDAAYSSNTVEVTTSSSHNAKPYVMRSAIGYSVNGDDMNWTVDCPSCEKEYEFSGYFDSDDKYSCKCGCTFYTEKIWIDDSNYIV